MNYKVIEFKKDNKNLIKQVVEIWNKEVFSKTVFAAFTEEEFVKNIINNIHFDENGFKIIEVNNKIIGYGNAVVIDNLSDSPGYLSFIVVKSEYQRQGVGTFILKELEKYLISKNKTYIRQMFLNPINLKWIIPNTNNRYHANAPGVVYNSAWYFFLLNNGFNVKGPNQDGYYMDISNYKHSNETLLKLKDLEEKGYFINYYNKDKHYGFEELFKALNNQDWQNKVDENLNKSNPDPMIVVVNNNEIVGWTGPLVTTKDKRGSFAGIGIHPKANNKGLGSMLFKELVYKSKLNGASYITLFTGSENIARFIYLKTGFKIVQSFAILVKNLYK